MKALLPMGTPAPDLDGLPEEVAGETTAQGDKGNSEGLLSGVFVMEKGVFKRVEEGWLWSATALERGSSTEPVLHSYSDRQAVRLITALRRD